MFRKLREKRQLENEMFSKLIKELDDPNRWLFDGKKEFKHIDLGIVLAYGSEGGYDGPYTHRYIFKPTRYDIPRRFRRDIKIRTDTIRERDASPDKLNFLNEFMIGRYKTMIEIDSNKRSQITIWMAENNITKFYIESNKIWFDNEEEAMAVKLKWI